MVGVGIALVVYLGVGVGAVTATEGPLADAGLDQTVTAGDTVYLDAGGSTAPDGDIQSYEWEIEAPSGTTIEPECSTCAKTSFATNDSGKYTVSVTVTDDEGRSDTDTLYVTAEPYDPPEVTVNGPSTVTVGERRTVSMSVTASAEPMSSVLWHHNGDHHTSATLSADWSATHQVNISFAEPGIHEINATVVDDKGYQASDGATVRVVPPEPYLAVSITDINNTVQTGDTLVVTASVENTGKAQATQSMSLTRNGTGVDDTTVSLGSGARQTLRFAWQAAESDEGTYEFGVHSANESETRYVTVNGAGSDAGNADSIPDGGEISPPGSGTGKSTEDLLIDKGQLSAKIRKTTKGLTVDMQFKPPDDWPEHIESVDIDPGKHDAMLVTPDGREFDIRDDGKIPASVSNVEEGTIKLTLNDDVSSPDHSRVEANEGETLEDAAEVPRPKNNNDNNDVGSSGHDGRQSITKYDTSGTSNDAISDESDNQIDIPAGAVGPPDTTHSDTDSQSTTEADPAEPSTGGMTQPDNNPTNNVGYVGPETIGSVREPGLELEPTPDPDNGLGRIGPT
ncbi:PKD domain-containing protein [Halovenus aranensis]|nr:PKD domain-containing protein [Halovenus aranensis]